MDLKTPHSFGRHGEIILKKVNKLPKNAKLKEKGNNLVIGHSETGHHHVMTLPKNNEVKIYELPNGEAYVQLPVNGTLKHEKTREAHAPQVFEKGTYIRIIRKSYSYADRAMRRVID